MAVTYDKTLAATRAKVRFLLVDTHEDTAAFTDDEIDNAITAGGSVDGAVNYLLRAAMAHAALRGDFNRVNALQTLLRVTGGELPTASIGEPNLLPMDDGFVEPS